MAVARSRRGPIPVNKGQRAAVPTHDENTGYPYTDALRRICDLATSALNLSQDEASREAVKAWIPEFHSIEEMDAWWDAQEKVEANVDPRLRERVKTSIRLSKKTIDGYNSLARQMGLRSGQTLMKIVLGNYLAKNLPEDF